MSESAKVLPDCTGAPKPKAVEHSPGPWAIDPDDRPGMHWNNHIVEAARPRMTICFMTHDNTPENAEGEANARLIAAAPDLLSALEKAYAILCPITHQWPGRHTMSGQHTLAAMRDAIASATGRDAQTIQNEGGA